MGEESTWQEERGHTERGHAHQAAGQPRGHEEKPGHCYQNAQSRAADRPAFLSRAFKREVPRRDAEVDTPMTSGPSQLWNWAACLAWGARA